MFRCIHTEEEVNRETDCPGNRERRDGCWTPAAGRYNTRRRHGGYGHCHRYTHQERKPETEATGGGSQGFSGTLLLGAEGRVYTKVLSQVEIRQTGHSNSKYKLTLELASFPVRSAEPKKTQSHSQATSHMCLYTHPSPCFQVPDTSP